jgi:2-polyprenyl-3-methyl-5-hydroxy-6-metoxy-1,4-benzoquinol methylase
MTYNNLDIYKNEIKQNIDIKALMKIKNKYPEINHKYFDYEYEILYKLNLAINYLHLDNMLTQKILDIGTGFGWFPLVMQSFGHLVKCSDIPSSYNNESMMYEEVLKCLGLQKDFSFFVKPLTKIPDVGKYDIITATGVIFHYKWEIKEWEFFLNDIFLHCNSMFYLHLNEYESTRLLNEYLNSNSNSTIKNWQCYKGYIFLINI